MSVADAYPAGCPIRPSLFVPRGWFWFSGQTVDEVGTFVRVGGGWVAPVMYRNGECALLRFRSDSAEVVELRSGSFNAQALLERSTRLPEVIEGPDPGILYLRVCDLENEDTPVAAEKVYHLQLHGILGHMGEECLDSVEATNEKWS